MLSNLKSIFSVGFYVDTNVASMSLYVRYKIHNKRRGQKLVSSLPMHYRWRSKFSSGTEARGWLRTPHFFSPVFAFRCKRYLTVKAIHSSVVHHNYVTRRSYKNGEDGSEMTFCRIH